MRRLLFAGLLLLAACGKEPDGIGVSQILVSDRVNIRQEIETPRSALTPADRTFYAHAFVTGLTAPTEVTGTWWYGEDPGVRIFQTNVTVTPDAPVAKFFLSNRKDWREGAYRIVIMAENRDIGSASLTVRQENLTGS